jgi:hypothetical protein
MPAEEVGDANTRFAVVIPTGAEAAALRSRNESGTFCGSTSTQ